jgi:hypothetical protein
MNSTFLAERESDHALPEQNIENVLSWKLFIEIPPLLGPTNKCFIGKVKGR